MPLNLKMYTPSYTKNIIRTNIFERKEKARKGNGRNFHRLTVYLGHLSSRNGVESRFLTDVSPPAGKVIVSYLRNKCHTRTLSRKADRWVDISSLCRKMETNTSEYMSSNKYADTHTIYVPSWLSCSPAHNPYIRKLTCNRKNTDVIRNQAK